MFCGRQTKLTDHVINSFKTTCGLQVPVDPVDFLLSSSSPAGTQPSQTRPYSGWRSPPAWQCCLGGRCTSSSDFGCSPVSPPAPSWSSESSHLSSPPEGRTSDRMSHTPLTFVCGHFPKNTGVKPQVSRCLLNRVFGKPEVNQVCGSMNSRLQLCRFPPGGWWWPESSRCCRLTWRYSRSALPAHRHLPVLAVLFPGRSPEPVLIHDTC